MKKFKAAKFKDKEQIIISCKSKLHAKKTKR